MTAQPDRAARALASVRGHAGDLEVEVLLLANGATEEMLTWARGLEDVVLAESEVDVGLPIAWNAGLRAACAGRVLVLHEDAELRAGTLERLVATLDADERVGAVSPRIVEGDAHGGKELWRDGWTTAFAPDALPSGSGPYPVDYSTSSVLLLHRGAALAAGGFDEALFPAMYADVALSARLWQAGRATLVDPRAEAAHAAGAMVRPSAGPTRGAAMRAFLGRHVRERFLAGYAGHLAGQAERAPDGPDAAERAAGRAVTQARFAAADATPRPAAPPPAPLVIGREAQEHARALRTRLEAAFVEDLVARVAALEADLAAAREARTTAETYARSLEDARRREGW